MKKSILLSILACLVSTTAFANGLKCGDQNAAISATARGKVACQGTACTVTWDTRGKLISARSNQYGDFSNLAKGRVTQESNGQKLCNADLQHAASKQMGPARAKP